VWLIIIKQYLTLDLLNTTTEQYKTMKANVMTKVSDMIGWLFIEGKRKKERKKERKRERKKVKKKGSKEGRDK